MDKKTEKENKLQLIPKAEKYIEYILQIILKLPRTEKFNIGNEFKLSMYRILKNAIYINKVWNNKEIENILGYLNKIDAELVLERIYLRIMLKNRWIDEKKFKISMENTWRANKTICQKQ